MLQALKRDQPRPARAALLDAPGGAAAPRETDATAELDSGGLLAAQQQVMRSQDTELDHLERSVGTVKHVALQINEEAALQNRLLTDLDADLDSTGARLAAAQRRLKLVMRRAGGCKTQLLVFLMVVILVVVLVLGFKVLA
jgi:hypothetical protein